MEKRDYKNLVTNGLKEEDGKLIFTFELPGVKKENKKEKKKKTATSK